MGRVSKYKKIKSFDPYSKKNGGNVDLSKVGVWGLGDNGQKAKKRSRRSEILRKNKGKKRRNNENEGFDLAPSGKDEFDLTDLLGSVKKQKLDTSLRDVPASHSEVKVAVKGNVASIPKTDQDEKKVAQILKAETKLKEDKKKQTIQAQSRMEGESKNAYARRTKSETRQIIKQTTEKKNVEKMKRKKEFLNNKKKKKKNNFSRFYGGDDGESDSEDVIVQKRKKGAASEPDQAQFGEQAERPPTFKQLPRGAKEKGENTKGKGKSAGMTDAQIEAEKNAMEMMRRRVQAQYASIKARRKQAGEFHL